MNSNIVNNELEYSLDKCFRNVFLQSAVSASGVKHFLDIIESSIPNNCMHAFPYSIFLKISSQCNLRCKHCFYYARQEVFSPDNDFSPNELLQLANFFVDELNIVHFVITGGEPFLRKDIFSLIDYLKSHNISIDLQTNATLITQEMANNLGSLLNPRADTIQVSLDGAEKLTHDKIRGRGNFEKAINAIRFLTNENVNVIVSYTVMSNNIDEIPKLYELCKELKVKQIRINKFKACSETQTYLSPDLSKMFIQCSRLIDKIADDKCISLILNFKAYDFLSFDSGKKLLNEHLKTNNTSIPQNLMCHNHGSLNVCADGKVYLCSNTEQDDFCLGNLKEQSFLEVWDNRHNNIFFQERPLEKATCKNCEYIIFCNSGCPADAYEAYGDINCPDGNCFYGKFLMQECRISGENYVK